jgi:hypothetical protein
MREPILQYSNTKDESIGEIMAKYVYKSVH